MAATMAENDGAGKTCPSSAISASPEPIPISAVAIGNPIASSEPNAISSTTAAAPTPIPLEAPPYGVSAWSTTSPPRLNVRPFPLAAVAPMEVVLGRGPEPRPQRDERGHPGDPHQYRDPAMPITGAS